MASTPCTTRLLSTVLCENCENTFVGREPHSVPTSDTFRSGSLSEVETSQARLLLQQDEMELKRYDKELATLGKVMEKLKSERTSLLESVARRRSLVSPMRRIPLEIWGLIFSEVVASWPRPLGAMFSAPYSLYVHYEHGDTETLPRTGDVLAPSMILSHVSSQWRTMLFSMPHLWASISVDIYGLTMDISSIIKMFLEKSARHPLTIEVRDSGWKAHPELDLKLKMMEEWGYDFESIGNCVFRDLMAQMDRCQDLRLDLGTGAGGRRVGYDIGTVPSSNVRSFPVLRSFSNQSFDAITPAYNSRRFWDALKNASGLSHFETADLHDFGRVPLHQITSLTIGRSGELRRLLEGLSGCTRLEELCLKDVRGVRSEVVRPIQLSSLRKFVLSITNNDQSPGLLLDSLTLPSLLILEVDAWFGLSASTEWLWLSLHGLLQRSSCDLGVLSLHLSGRVLASGISYLRQILRITSTLTTFNLGVREGYKQTEEALRGCISNLLSGITVPTEGWLIPKLQRFSLRIHQHDHLLQKTKVGEEVLAFAELRSKHNLATLEGKVSALSELSLTFHKSPGCIEKHRQGLALPLARDTLLPRLRQLTAGGMKCTLDEFVGFK